MATTKTIAARTTKAGRIDALVKEIEKNINHIEKNTLNHPCIVTPP